MVRLETALVVFAALVSLSNAVVRNGTCPSLPTKNDFDIEKYCGRWYLYQTFGHQSESQFKCGGIEYTPVSYLVLKVRHFGINATSGEVYTQQGSLITPDKTQLAKLALEFPEVPVTLSTQILATDYKTYGLKYSCLQLGPSLYRETSHIVTRRRGKLARRIRRRLYRLLEADGVDASQFFTQDHTGCRNCN